MDILKNLEMDLWLRHVDRLPNLDVAGYDTLDARLAWKPRKDLELSVTGQNLLEKTHAEFTTQPSTPLAVQRLLVERSVYGKVAWSF